jgi:hypothetical protein
LPENTVTFPRFRRPPDTETFRFPLPRHGRLALVDTRLRGAAAAANFTSTDLAAIEAFAPESIALPLPVALTYATQRLAGVNILPSLRCAIVVLSSLPTPGGPMTDDHRDLLWRAFGLPVFEQLLGSDGLVIASECEVHDGLHAERASIRGENGEAVVAGQASGCSAEIVTGHCDCGLETPRLRNIAPIRERAAVAAA